MSTQSYQLCNPAVDAEKWFVRMESGPVDRATREGFTEWLLQSHGHVAAYLALSEIRGSLLATSHLPPVRDLVLGAVVGDESGVSAGGCGGTKRPWAAVRWALVALVAMFVLGIAAPLFWRNADWLFGMRYTTAASETRLLPLDDGSVVQLSADTEVLVRMTAAERRVVVFRGEAFFVVAHEANRPFTVSSAGTKVHALGTEFSVRRTSTEVARVQVVRGSVAVTDSGLSFDGMVPMPLKAVNTLLAGDIATVRDGRILEQLTRNPDLGVGGRADP
jgi:transmembrane sensor